MRITCTTMNQICGLTETLSPAHRRMVATNVRSIAEASFSPTAWMRAIYADETPIGFIMAHTGSDYDDGIDCPSVFLWRFMIGGPWPERHAGKIDSFIVARGLGLANFVLNDPNPAWKVQADDFIERVEKRLLGLMERNGV